MSIHWQTVQYCCITVYSSEKQTKNIFLIHWDFKCISFYKNLEVRISTFNVSYPLWSQNPVFHLKVIYSPSRKKQTKKQTHLFTYFMNSIRFSFFTFSAMQNLLEHLQECLKVSNAKEIYNISLCLQDYIITCHVSRKLLDTTSRKLIFTWTRSPNLKLDLPNNFSF